MWRPGRPSSPSTSAPSAAKRSGAVWRGIGQVRAGQVGAAAEQLGQRRGEAPRARAGSPCGWPPSAPWRCAATRGIDRDLREILRQPALDAADEFDRELRMRLAVGLEAPRPSASRRQARRAGIPGLVDRFGNHERLAGPSRAPRASARSRRRRAPRRAPWRCRRGSASPCRSSSCSRSASACRRPTARRRSRRRPHRRHGRRSRRSRSSRRRGSAAACRR